MAKLLEANIRSRSRAGLKTKARSETKGASIPWPSTRTHRDLEEVLGCPRNWNSRQLFELGGNPELASRMLQRAEEVCGTPINPSSAFSNNLTIEALAAEIVDEAIDESANLLTVQERGARTRFSICTEIFSRRIYTLKLSRALGRINLLRSSAAPSPRTSETPSIERWLRHTCRQYAPSVLTGLHHRRILFGAIIAYELAQQIAPAVRLLKC